MAHNGGRRSATKYDVEIRRIRHDTVRAVIPWFGRIGVVAGAWFPLERVDVGVTALAGHNTSLNVAVSVSLAANIIITGGYFTEKVRRSRQTREMEGLRQKLAAYQEVGLKSATALPKGRT